MDIEQRLAVERQQALDRLASLTDDYDAVVAASLDTNADDEHDPEGHTIAFERSQIGALVRQVRYPVYLPGLPLTDIASLERWVPTLPLVAPEVSSREVEQGGFATPGTDGSSTSRFRTASDRGAGSARYGRPGPRTAGTPPTSRRPSRPGSRR